METWNASYSVGVIEMDEQHKRLLGYIAALGELLMTRDFELMHELLARITDYGRQHFAAEEQLLERHGYPVAAQRAAHESYQEWMIETNVRAMTEVPVAEIHAYLRQWWMTHILGEDMRYKDFLNSRGVS